MNYLLHQWQEFSFCLLQSYISEMWIMRTEAAVVSISSIIILCSSFYMLGIYMIKRQLKNVQVNNIIDSGLKTCVRRYMISKVAVEKYDLRVHIEHDHQSTPYFENDDWVAVRESVYRVYLHRERPSQN